MKLIIHLRIAKLLYEAFFQLLYSYLFIIIIILKFEC